MSTLEGNGTHKNGSVVVISIGRGNELIGVHVLNAPYVIRRYVAVVIEIRILTCEHAFDGESIREIVVFLCFVLVKQEIIYNGNRVGAIR